MLTTSENQTRFMAYSISKTFISVLHIIDNAFDEQEENSFLEKQICLNSMSKLLALIKTDFKSTQLAFLFSVKLIPQLESLMSNSELFSLLEECLRMCFQHNNSQHSTFLVFVAIELFELIHLFSESIQEDFLKWIQQQSSLFSELIFKEHIFISLEKNNNSHQTIGTEFFLMNLAFLSMLQHVLEPIISSNPSKQIPIIQNFFLKLTSHILAHDLSSISNSEIPRWNNLTLKMISPQTPIQLIGRLLLRNWVRFSKVLLIESEKTKNSNNISKFVSLISDPIFEEVWFSLNGLVASPLHNANSLFDFFGNNEDDDVLVDLTLDLLQIYKSLSEFQAQKSKNEMHWLFSKDFLLKFHPNKLFLCFSKLMNNDIDLLLDLLLSPETKFLELLVLYTKFFIDQRSSKTVHPISTELEQDLKSNISILNQLRDRIEPMQKKQLFPFNVNPLLKLLVKLK